MVIKENLSFTYVCIIICFIVPKQYFDNMKRLDEKVYSQNSFIFCHIANESEPMKFLIE